MVDPYPDPNVTPANWGQMLNDAIESRYDQNADDIADHIADTAGAHNASAIASSAVDWIVATNVQDAITEIATEMVQRASVVASATQSITTQTPTALTSQVFTIPPGKTLTLDGILIFQSTTNVDSGGAYGITVAQPAGASGNAQGSYDIEVAISASAVATSERDGDQINVAAAATTTFEVVGSAVSATNANHVARLKAVIKNTAAAHSTTVTVVFRAEVAARTIVAQIGTAAVGVLGSL